MTMLAALLFAASNSLAAIPMVDLERHYWDCNYAATQSMLDTVDAEFCSRVYERLKAEKFNGDYQKFMKWWADNKTRENAARAKKK